MEESSCRSGQPPHAPARASHTVPGQLRRSPLCYRNGDKRNPSAHQPPSKYRLARWRCTRFGASVQRPHRSSGHASISSPYKCPRGLSLTRLSSEFHNEPPVAEGKPTCTVRPVPSTSFFSACVKFTTYALVPLYVPFRRSGARATTEAMLISRPFLRATK